MATNPESLNKISKTMNTPVLRRAIQEEMKKNINMQALGEPAAPTIDPNVPNLQLNNVGGWEQMVSNTQPPDLQQEIGNYISNLPPVQPTGMVDKVKGFASDALQRGGQIGGQALGLGGQALGGLLDIAKKPETWRTAADLMAIASAPYSPQLAETYSGISGRIGDRMEARDLLEQKVLEDAKQTIKDENQLEIDNKKHIANLFKQGFRPVKEGENLDPRYIVTINDLKGNPITLYNSKIEQGDTKAAYERGQLKAIISNPTKGNVWIDEETYKRYRKLPGYRNLVRERKDGEKTRYEFDAITNKKIADDYLTVRERLFKSTDAANDTSEKVDSIINHPEFEKIIGKVAIGPIRLSKSGLKQKTGTVTAEQTDLIQLVESLTSGTLISTLEKMRSAKTGATGFGQLNEKEFEALRNAVVSFEKDQTPAQMKRNLLKIKRLTELNRRRRYSYAKSIYGDRGVKDILLPDLGLPDGSIEEGERLFQ